MTVKLNLKLKKCYTLNVEYDLGSCTQYLCICNRPATSLIVMHTYVQIFLHLLEGV